MIEANNLTKSFITPRGRIDVLKDLSFTINERSFVGITGKSGAGKVPFFLSLQVSRNQTAEALQSMTQIFFPLMIKNSAPSEIKI